MSAISAQPTVRVVDVVVDPRSGGIESVWTYQAGPEIAEGDAVFVRLGPRAVIGFVIKAYETREGDLGFPLAQLKPVLDKVEGLGLPAQLMEMVRFTAEQYLCPFSLSLSAATPSGFRSRIVSAWRLTDVERSLPLTPLQKEILRTIQECGGSLVQRPTKKLPPQTLRALKLLRSKGLVAQQLQLLPSDEKKDRTELIRITPDAVKIEAFLHTEGKRRPAQALTLMKLQTGEPAPLTSGEIKALSGVTDTTIRTMIESGLLERVEQGALAPRKPPEPNEHQRRAIEEIVASIGEPRFEPFLLYGVTGSGKTEVYLRAAAEALKAGRQVLYLVPEIALATQAITLLRERFGNNVAMLHSELSDAERLESWIRVRNGKCPIVLGARSALFAPLNNLGLIIVDEEHETSYKQEASPRYHAKRLALFLGEQHRAAVVLGSASPNVESFHEAKEGCLKLLSLPKRAASAQLPTVEIVDLAQLYQANNPSILSPRLYDAMEDTLDKGQQVILFLNRRAYSPFLICRDCGHQFACPRCAVSLAYSRSDRRLRCHHCGYSERPPDKCPDCGGTRLNPFGIGTEKVEESVRQQFLNAKVARLDRDIARRKGALEDILARFRSEEIHILVGTQMVAKGLDFPNVTLVGVIAADVSLNVPDFRAAERTFQLLSQVAGRAGRGTAPGHVIIQTFNPKHVAVACAQSHDYERLYSVIELERRQAAYPPYMRIVNVVLSGEQLSLVEDAGREVAEILEELEDAIVLGPTPCPIERLQNRWRRHLLVKLAPDVTVDRLGALLRRFVSKEVTLVADVDPYSLM